MAGPMDFVTEAFVLLGIALGVIGLRTYARWKSVGWANFQWDDYLMIFSGVCSLIIITSRPDMTDLCTMM